jgi:NIMA (never in mitosis gene a)-related kinase
MEKYRKLKVIGKGSFGYAVLVQSVVDRQTYVMKVILSTLNLIDH